MKNIIIKSLLSVLLFSCATNVVAAGLPAQHKSKGSIAALLFDSPSGVAAGSSAQRGLKVHDRLKNKLGLKVAKSNTYEVIVQNMPEQSHYLDQFFASSETKRIIDDIHSDYAKGRQVDVKAATLKMAKVATKLAYEDDATMKDLEEAIRFGEVAQVKSFLKSSPGLIKAKCSTGMKLLEMIEVYADVYKDDPEKNKLHEVYNACKRSAKKKK